MIMTRKGSKVIIYDTEAPSSRPWIGRYQDSPGGDWVVCSWLAGGFYLDTGPSALDLIVKETNEEKNVA